MSELLISTCYAQVGVPKELEVDMVIGADGANSRVAKEIGAGDYDYAIAFQVRRRDFRHSCARAAVPAATSLAWSCSSL